MKKRLFNAMLLTGAILISFSLCSCGAKSVKKDLECNNAVTGEECPAPMIEPNYSVKNEAYDEAKADTTTGDVSLDKTIDKNKLIIRNSLVIQTKDFDKYIASIEKLVADAKGYIERESVYNGSYNGNDEKSATYTFRIPKNGANSFDAGLSVLNGNIVRTDKTVENVTKEYADLDRRVSVVKAKEDRLLELMKKADKIKDLIEIEKELAELVESRENMSSQMISIDHDVAYDYYDVEISEVREYVQVKQEKSFLSDMGYAFKQSIKGFIGFLQGFALFIAYNWLILLALILIGVFAGKLIKKYLKKQKALKDARINALQSINPNQGVNQSLYQNPYKNIDSNTNQDLNQNEERHDN